MEGVGPRAAGFGPGEVIEDGLGEKLPLSKFGDASQLGGLCWRDLDVGSSHGCRGTTWAAWGVWWSVASLVHQGAAQAGGSGRQGHRTLVGVKTSRRSEVVSQA